MHFSTVASAAALVLACTVSAAPLQARDVIMVTDYVSDVTMVTVTVDAPYADATANLVAISASSSSSSISRKKHHHKHTYSSTPTSIPTGYVVITSVYEVYPTDAPVAVTTDESEPVETEAPAPVTTAETVATPEPVTSSEVSVATSTASTGNAFADAIVKYHNEARAKYGADPISWKQELADYGQANVGTCIMAHTLPYKYGENLAMGTNTDAEAAVSMWMSEAAAYTDATGFSEATGHFTQVVWKSTKSVGCGIQTCGDQNYIKCEYEVGGNLLGSFLSNVQAKASY